MEVIKRDGRHQEFEAGKLFRSIMNSADDRGVTLSEKEAHLLADDVRKRLERLRGTDGLTSSWEIRGVMTEVMENSGFEKIAGHYNKRLV